MMENPYQPPVANTPSTIRRIGWWNRAAMIAVLLASLTPMVSVVVLYLPLVQMGFRHGASFTADTGDWLGYALMTALAFAMAAGGILLMFRRKWSLHLFLAAFALLVFGSIGGLLAPKALAWIIIAAIIGYTFFLGRRSYLH